MSSRGKKKARRSQQQQLGDEDRISRLPDELIHHVLSHNLHCLNLDLPYDSKPINLSAFTSESLNKLTLKVNLEECELISDWNKLTLKVNLEECELISDCWDLPCLTTLRLKGMDHHSTFSDNWFTIKCLPALRKLHLDGYNLSESSFSFHLPALTTLCLSSCRLPATVWDFPALKCIELRGGELHILCAC